MLIKQLILGAIIAVSSISATFAGTEDWNGQFEVRHKNGQTFSASHSPANVQFIFFSAGECIHFGKGSQINGMQFDNDIDLCRNDKVETFIAGLQKSGTIITKKIKLGSTYPSS